MINHILKELVDSKYELMSVKDLVPLDLTNITQKSLLQMSENHQHNLFSDKAGRAKVSLHQPLLKPDAVPQYAQPYIILESIKELTKKKLDQLIQEDIIRKAEVTL